MEGGSEAAPALLLPWKLGETEGLGLSVHPGALPMQDYSLPADPGLGRAREGQWHVILRKGLFPSEFRAGAWNGALGLQGELFLS